MKQLRTIVVVVLVLLTLATLVFAAGCEKSQEPTAPGVVVDDLGRSIDIEEIPQRIISLAPSNTEILFTLGLGDKVVGVTDYCDYPEEAKSKEKIGGCTDPSIEKIVSLEPDLILAAGVNPMKVIDTLEEHGLTVFGIESTDLEDLLNDINTVGKITGAETEAKTLTNNMQNRINAVTDKMKGLSTEEKPRTFQICWHNPPWTAGQGTFVNDIIEKAGGTNIFADLEGWKSVSLEEIVARDPEVIIVTAMGGTSSETWNWVNTEPRLEDTAARENGRAYFVESDWVELAGPRAVDGLEAIAKCVHPEIFGEPEE